MTISAACDGEPEPYLVDLSMWFIKDDDTQLHLAACKFANDRQSESIKYRTDNKLKPFDEDKTRAKWLAHYEGFVAGWKARQS